MDCHWLIAMMLQMAVDFSPSQAWFHDSSPTAVSNLFTRPNCGLYRNENRMPATVIELVAELLQHRRQDEREPHLEDQRDHRVRRVVEQRAPEHRVVERDAVVLDAHEDGGGLERAPGEEAEPDVVDDRVVDEHHEKGDGGCHPHEGPPAAE